MKKRLIALFLFDDVEVLDFAGPFEVFSVTNELNEHRLFDIATVSRDGTAVVARNGLSVAPDRALSALGQTDILIVPGGAGTRQVLQQVDTLDGLQRCATGAEIVFSVCSGALLLARLGLLNGLAATTHHEVFDTLATLAPHTRLERDVRYVDNGKIVTAAGISAGLDASLHLVERLYGEEVATRTAAYMEYRREP